jgi:Na+-transporting methylmalonyl-CoA/oxaloacetate decarboxylase gamma subunit
MSEIIQTAINLPWGKIMGTLMIRFVGVFLVLLILMAGMIILGKIVSSLVERQERKKAEGGEQPDKASALIDEPDSQAGEEEIVAAIGAAIAMAMDQQQKSIAQPTLAGANAGSWAMAGRSAQINIRLQGGSQRRS